MVIHHRYFIYKSAIIPPFIFFNLMLICRFELKAMVDGSGRKNNSYAVVEIMPDKNIIVTGYRKAVSQDISRA